MSDEPRDFEPLMISIENALAAIDQHAQGQALDDAVQALRTQFEQYAADSCRRAHVVRDEPARTAY